MEYAAVLLPSLGVGLIFYFIMRWIFRADGAERRARSVSEDDASRWYEQVRSRDGGEVFTEESARDAAPPRAEGIPGKTSE